MIILEAVQREGLLKRGSAMQYSYDHDRFVNKNRTIARSYEIERRDAGLERKGFSRLQRQGRASCFTCKLKNKCSEYRGKKSGGSAGVVSFGGDDTFICNRYTPAPAENRSMTNKQIKSLLKNVKRGY